MIPYATMRVDSNITEAIDNWYEFGMSPGSCTEFLLRGDYERALRSAHPMIKPYWDDHIRYVEQCVAPECRGENYDKWRGVEFYNSRHEFQEDEEMELFTI
jgi:hypothetical protein